MRCSESSRKDEAHVVAAAHLADRYDKSLQVGGKPTLAGAEGAAGGRTDAGADVLQLAPEAGRSFAKRV